MSTGTASSIVQAAYEDAGLCAVGSGISANQTARGLSRLEDMIQLWGTQGLKLWLQEDVAVPLVALQAAYTFMPAGDVSMVKPLAILQGAYVLNSGVRQPLTVASKDEYFRLPQYNSYGAINTYFTQKNQTNLTVYFWSTPDVAAAANGFCSLLVRKAVANPASIAAQMAFPPEWYIALRWGLADELTTGQPDSIVTRCATRAAAYRTALEDFDVEDAPTYFQPDQRMQYGAANFR